jgi:hypothetical protein
MTRTLWLPLAMIGCGTPDASEFAEALPDERLVIPLEAATAARAAGEPSEYQILTRGVATDVNGFVVSVVETVRYVTGFDPTWKDGDTDVALWGPFEDDGIESQLWVQREADGYTWAIEVRAVGSEPWLAMVAGTSVPDGSGGASGEFAFDFDVAGQVDPSSGGAGAMVVSYDIRADETTGTVAFEDVVGDDAEVLTGATTWAHRADGSGSMDLAIEADATEGGVAELVILRSRWQADEAGRGDAWITGGDLGELVYTGTECWDGLGMLTFYEDNASLESGGDAAACVFAEAEFNESNGTM